MAGGDSSIYNDDTPEVTIRVAGPGFELAKSPTDPMNTQFGSWHTGGICLFVFGDGHVHPIPATIGPITLAAHATRAGGEVTIGDW